MSGPQLAKKLVCQGYADVRYYEGGLSDWIAHGGRTEGPCRPSMITHCPNGSYPNGDWCSATFGDWMYEHGAWRRAPSDSEPYRQWAREAFRMNASLLTC